MIKMNTCLKTITTSSHINPYSMAGIFADVQAYPMSDDNSPALAILGIAILIICIISFFLVKRMRDRKNDK